MPVTKTCVVCGKKFKPHYRQIACSSECRKTYKRSWYKRYYHDYYHRSPKCRLTKKSYSQRPEVAARRRARMAARRKSRRIICTKRCLICGGIFEPYRSTQIICSRSRKPECFKTHLKNYQSSESYKESSRNSRQRPGCRVRANAYERSAKCRAYRRRYKKQRIVQLDLSSFIRQAKELLNEHRNADTA